MEQQNQQLSEYYWTVMKPKQKAGTVIAYPKLQPPNCEFASCPN